MSFAGVGAAWKVADVEQGSTVAIFGLGAVGLAVIHLTLARIFLIWTSIPDFQNHSTL